MTTAAATPFRILTERDRICLSAALEGAGLFGRDDLAAIAVTGRHRARFLHALLTWDVNNMAAPSVADSAFCDAQGRIHGLLQIVVESDRIVLWTDRAAAQGLMHGLLAYRVAERVKLALEPELGLLEVIGPNARDVIERAGLSWPDAGTVAPWQFADHAGLCWTSTTGGRPGAPHGEGVSALAIQAPDDAIGDLAGALMDAGCTVGCHAAREALRILAGRPRLHQDVDEGSLPIELGLGASVHLEKGCYLGQEAIAMQAYRGRLRRHMCWVEATGDASLAAGWTLRTAEGRKAGRLGGGFVDTDGRALGLALVSRRTWQPDLALQATPPEGEAQLVRTLTTTEPDPFRSRET